MILHVKDPEGTILGMMTIDRDSATCIIVGCPTDRLGELVPVAKSLKVAHIYFMATNDQVDEMLSIGWTKSPTCIMEMNNGK